MLKLLTLLLIFLPLPAFANGISPDGKKIVFHLTPETTNTIQISGWSRDREFTANNCGLVVIRKLRSSSSLTGVHLVNSSIMMSNLPVQTIPNCIENRLGESRPNNFKFSDGIVLVGFPPGSTVKIRIQEDTDRFVKANGCGIASISLPKKLPGFNPGWYLEGTSFRLPNGNVLYADDLLSTEDQTICRKIGGAYMKYAPLKP